MTVNDPLLPDSVPPALTGGGKFWHPNVFGEVFRTEQVVYGRLYGDEFSAIRRVEMGLRDLPAMPSMLALAAWVETQMPGWVIAHAQYGSPYLDHLAKTTIHVVASKRREYE